MFIHVFMCAVFFTTQYYLPKKIQHIFVFVHIELSVDIALFGVNTAKRCTLCSQIQSSFAKI